MVSSQGFFSQISAQWARSCDSIGFKRLPPCNHPHLHPTSLLCFILLRCPSCIPGWWPVTTAEGGLPGHCVALLQCFSLYHNITLFLEEKMEGNILILPFCLHTVASSCQNIPEQQLGILRSFKCIRWTKYYTGTFSYSCTSPLTSGPLGINSVIWELSGSEPGSRQPCRCGSQPIFHRLLKQRFTKWGKGHLLNVVTGKRNK